MREFNRVIFGATALTAGLSFKLAENDLIIEKNIYSGAEFCQSLNAKPIDIDADYAGETKAFLEELKSKNILGDDGHYSAIPVSAVLSSYLLKSPANILLDCVVTSVKKQNNEYIIEYFGENGFYEISAKQIIDTTDIGVLDELKGLAKKNYLANLDGCNENAECNTIKGYLKGEYYLKINAENLDFISARAEILRIAKENGIKIAAFSPVFAYDYEDIYFKADENYTSCPSASFGDIGKAFDFGIKGVF